MSKLTPEQIKEIKESDKRIIDLARKFNVTPTAIRYYRSEEFREWLREYQKERYRNMSPEEKKAYLDKKRDYQRQYHRKRYNNDPEFRKKQIEFIKNSRNRYSLGLARRGTEKL